ncbi:hypothetical protein D3C72_2142130 [compost metagenome]
MASLLAAIGRVSPCAATRPMCSSGAACSHTVVQWASSSLKVAGSDTMPPGVAMTTSL